MAPSDREIIAHNEYNISLGGKCERSNDNLAIRKGAGAFPLLTSPARVDQHGAFPSLHAVLTDRIESRNTEEKLRQLAIAVEAVADGVAIMSADGTIFYVNPAYLKMTGYEKREVVGQNVRIFRNTSHPLPFYKAMLRTISSGETWAGRVTLERRDGSVIENEITISPVSDGTGAIVNYALVARDVTQKVRMEEQIKQGNKMEAIGALAGGIAHDFNNILAAIMGFTELALGDVPSDSSARARMRQVLRAAVRGRELVRQILAFSRKSDEKSMVISVTPLLNETLALLRVSIPSSIAVKVSMTAGNDTVKASGSNLQQVIMNLVVNAAQAVPRDGGSIEITLEEKEFRNAARLPNRDMQLGNYIALTVRDNGHGMSQTTRKRIFEPFFTTKETDTGTGIGLSMVYEIVKGHGGGITVWSKPDRGTTFRVFLPLIHVSGREDGTSVANTVGGSERIIFVDDEEAILESTVTILQRFGYKTTGFTDSEKALEYFTANRERVDLLIADYDMPNMTGIELAERSRRLKPDLRVIIVTGYHGSISAENAREAGIDELVMKPFTKQELGEVVHRVLTSDATGNEGPPRLSPK